MPIKIKSTSGGSVTIDVPSTAVDTTMILPVTNSGLVSNNNPTISGPVLTGNVAISGASSYLNINGNNVSPYTMRNRIINGDFRIDQRFAGAANNNITGSQYVVDRWYSYAGGGPAPGKLRYQQNNTNGPGSSATQIATGFPNYFGANVVSSNTVNGPDQWSMSQVIEGLNISDLAWGTSNAAPVTLSFWVYSSIAGTHGASILNKGVGRSYPFTYSVTTANTWQYQTITIPGDTTGSWLSNNDVGMYVVYPMGAGSDYNGTNNTWNSGNKYPTGTVNVVSNANGSFYLTGVQLEKGSQATPFEFRHYTTELQLCQRYCYIIPTNNYYLTTIQAWSTTRAQGYIPFPVTMRTGANLVNPSSLSGATCYGPTGTAINISTFALAVPVAAQNPTAAFIDVTVASGLTAGYAVMLYTTPTAGPTIFSAELGVQN